MARTATKKYLNVKYHERELAKKLGARWDPAVQRWYCPAGAALETIFRWRAQAAAAQGAKIAPKTVAYNENFELPLLVG